MSVSCLKPTPFKGSTFIESGARVTLIAVQLVPFHTQRYTLGPYVATRISDRLGFDAFGIGNKYTGPFMPALFAASTSHLVDAVFRPPRLSPEKISIVE